MSDATGAADGELLEFLGSVDGEGEGWGEYLEDTDLGRVAASAPPPARPPQAASPPAPSPPAAPPPVAPPSRPAAPPARTPQPGSQP